jgi:nucleotide-binding universal stress UspA family protein
MTTDHAHSPTSLRFRGGRVEGKSQVTVGRRRLATARGWLATSSWSPRLAVAALVAVMVSAAALAYLPFTQTPSPQPASAPADVFSADRALVELRAVAAQPRPMGSTEHETAIGTIRDRLTELGVESEVVEGSPPATTVHQVLRAE